MGQNLILNMNDHGFVVCAYNRTPDKVTKFLENEAKNTNVKIDFALHLIWYKVFLFSLDTFRQGRGCQNARGNGGQVEKAPTSHAYGQSWSSRR